MKKPMSPRHEAHLQFIIEYCSHRLDGKYRKGVAEHGGHLQEFSILELLENAMDEAIDQCTYLAEAIKQERARLNASAEVIVKANGHYADCSRVESAAG